jgi:hypothetical protein
VILETNQLAGMVANQGQAAHAALIFAAEVLRARMGWTTLVAAEALAESI